MNWIHGIEAKNHKIRIDSNNILYEILGTNKDEVWKYSSSGPRETII